MSTKEYWDITNSPHTKLKLEIYKKYLDSWCSIFKKQEWAKNVYIVDCFAGAGIYKDGNNFVDGSPIITAKTIKKFKSEKDFKVKCFFVEKDKKCFKKLYDLLQPYKEEVDFEVIYDDFNNAIKNILIEIGHKPTLFFIDPFGIKEVKKESILAIVNKPGAKDILLNYINEGVIRIAGVTRKCMDKKVEEMTTKEIKTINNLLDFIGSECLDYIDSKDVEFLKYYVDYILKSNNKNVNEKNKLDVIAFDMPYPNKSDTIYYLLFASRNKNAVKIVSQVYAKSKEINLI